MSNRAKVVGDENGSAIEAESKYKRRVQQDCVSATHVRADSKTIPKEAVEMTQ